MAASRIWFDGDAADPVHAKPFIFDAVANLNFNANLIHPTPVKGREFGRKG
jgi:hypothetical protein